MNRKHTIDEYLNIFEKLKKINSEIEFSSDFIIGYPGEDENDFKDTLNLINKIKFINSYSFVFSPRPGTRAEKLKQIDKNITSARLKIIQKQLLENQIKKNNSFENKIIKVLVENQTDDKTKLFGRSEYMSSVIFDGNKNLIGKFMDIKILKSNQLTMFGEIDQISKMKVA